MTKKTYKNLIDQYKIQYDHPTSEPNHDMIIHCEVGGVLWCASISGDVKECIEEYGLAVWEDIENILIMQFTKDTIEGWLDAYQENDVSMVQ